MLDPVPGVGPLTLFCKGIIRTMLLTWFIFGFIALIAGVIAGWFSRAGYLKGMLFGLWTSVFLATGLLVYGIGMNGWSLNHLSHILRSMMMPFVIFFALPAVSGGFIGVEIYRLRHSNELGELVTAEPIDAPNDVSVTPDDNS